MDGDDLFAPKRGEKVADFFRGKLAPVPGIILDVIKGEKITGEKTTVGNELKSMIPFSFQSVGDAWNQYGIKSLVNVFVPSILGAGVQTYEPRKREVKSEISITIKKAGKDTQAKVELSDSQYKEYKDLAEKYIDKVDAELKIDKDYKDLSPEERQNMKRNFENRAVKKAKDEIVKKYRTALEKNAVPKEKSKESDQVEKRLKDKL